jgi:hypothetical protein
MKVGEERTAGSDQKARYSSGGPISLDPCFLYTLYLANINDNFELLSIGGGEGGGVRLTNYTLIIFNKADFTDFKNIRFEGLYFISTASFHILEKYTEEIF